MSLSKNASPESISVSLLDMSNRERITAKADPQNIIKAIEELMRNGHKFFVRQVDDAAETTITRIR